MTYSKTPGGKVEIVTQDYVKTRHNNIALDFKKLHTHTDSRGHHYLLLENDVSEILVSVPTSTQTASMELLWIYTCIIEFRVCLSVSKKIILLYFAEIQTVPKSCRIFLHNISKIWHFLSR